MKKPFSAYKGPEPYVFICYAHRDKEDVYQDLSMLDKRGVRVWYDEGIPAGSSWRGEIATAVSGASKFLFFISKESLASTHCLQEVRFALDNNIDVLPIYLEECTLPAELALALGGVQVLYRDTDSIYLERLEQASKHFSRIADSTLPRPHQSDRKAPLLVLIAFAITVSAGLGWGALHLVSLILPAFKSPEWVLSLLSILLATGVPTSLFLAWMYDVRPAEIRRKTHRTAADRTEVTAEESSRSGEITVESAIPVDKSIAVLPLTNLSPIVENAYFCDGVHDEILNQLSKISDIRVVSRSATLQYRDTVVRTKDIASALNVSRIMEGSVRYADNRVRIHTQLIKAEDDTQLWSEIYESEFNDIFKIQSDVALKAASAMQAKMMPEEISRIERPATKSIEAYTLFLKAVARENEQSNRITGERDGWIEAGIRDLEKSLELDPEFARGFAQLGWLQILKRYTVAFNVEESNQLLVDAKFNAEKALSIDPSIVYAYSVLAFVAFERHLWAEWEELELKCAALPDAKSGILLNFAERLGRVGRFDEALEVIDRSISLDPVRAHNREYRTYYQVLGGHYQSALDSAERYLSAGGDQSAYHLYRSIAYYFTNREDKALKELEAVTGDLSGAHLNCPIFCAFLHSRLRGIEAAEDYVTRQKSPVAKEFADFGRALGNRDFDHAFGNLKRYLRGGQVVSNLGEILDEIRLDTRWQMVVDYLATPKSS
ncbi:MAG: TIR domain-containing protein [Halioglobus sp.]